MQTRGKAAVQQDTMDLASYIYSSENNREDEQFLSDQTHLGLFLNRDVTFQHLDKEGKKSYKCRKDTQLKKIVQR